MPDSGEFIINETGYYLINWWVATAGAMALDVEFAIQLNGTTESQTASPIMNGPVTGTSIVEVTAVPAILTLINDTGAEMYILTTSVLAGITIVRVSSIT